MKLLLEPGAFRWDGTMVVLDQSGHTRYRVIGDGYRLGKRIHVRDLAGREAIYIRQVVPSLLPKYEIEVYGRPVGTLVRQINENRYFVEDLNWEICGDLAEGSYDVIFGQTIAASCRGGDKQGTLLLDCGDEGLKSLAVMLLISCVLGPMEPKSKSEIGHG